MPSKPLAILEDLKDVYRDAGLGKASCFSGLFVRTLIERIARAEAENATLRARNDALGTQLYELNIELLRRADRIAELEAQLQRAMDLIRYQRIELLDAELISEAEYAALTADDENGQRVARLAAYDKVRAQLQQARKAAQWVPIDAEHLPKVGDEILATDSDMCILMVTKVIEAEFMRRIPLHGLCAPWTHYRPHRRPSAGKGDTMTQRYAVPEEIVRRVSSVSISSGMPLGLTFDDYQIICDAFAKIQSENPQVPMKIISDLRHEWDAGDHGIISADYNVFMAEGILRRMYLATEPEYPEIADILKEFRRGGTAYNAAIEAFCRGKKAGKEPEK